MTFIHHETVTAAGSNVDGVGEYNIIETNEGFMVYEGGYCHTSSGAYETFEEAMQKATELAVEFDGDPRI